MSSTQLSQSFQQRRELYRQALPQMAYGAYFNALRLGDSVTKSKEEALKFLADYRVCNKADYEYVTELLDIFNSPSHDWNLRGIEKFCEGALLADGSLQSDVNPAQFISMVLWIASEGKQGDAP